MAGEYDGQLVQALLGNIGNPLQQAGQAQQQAQVAQFNAVRLREAEREQQQRAAYDTDVAGYLANPTAASLSGLIARYPQQHEALQQAWKVKTDSQRQSDLSMLGSAHAALANGRPELAISGLRARRDAERNAGMDTQHLDEMLEELASGDPDAIKAVQGGLLAEISAGDPDKFYSANQKALGAGPKDTHVISAGGALVDDAGRELYRAPEGVKYETVRNGDGSQSVVAVGGQGGHGPEGPAPAASGRTPTGAADGKFGTYVAQFLFPQEGGYVGRDGRSGAPANFGINQRANPDVDVRNLTRAQASKLYFDRYWKASGADKLPAGLAEIQADTAVNAGVGTAQRLLKASGGDPARYLELREQHFRGLNQPENLPTWLRRNADLRAYVAVGDRPVGAATELYRSAPATPKAGYTLLSPEEATGLGLDGSVRYQRSPTGQVAPIGGQRANRGADGLKNLPPKVLDAVASNRTQVGEVDRMLALLDPANASPAAKAARYSIGPSNRVVPAWVTQYTDGGGEDFRSQIGRTGGIIIKDVSGAAVSASEDNRLARWVPLPTDTPQAARAKLVNLRRGILAKNSEITATYGPENGYRAYQAPKPAARAGAARARAAAPAAASGFRILGVRDK